MKVVFYSTGCPNCRMLEAKLKAKGIKYEIESDIKVMEEKEFMSMPMLEVDGKIMNYAAASQWLNNIK